MLEDEIGDQHQRHAAQQRQIGQRPGAPLAQGPLLHPEVLQHAPRELAAVLDVVAEPEHRDDEGGGDEAVPQAVHPRYRTPFRSILFLIPIGVVFAVWVPLAQVITFSILSGLLNYTFMPINMHNFRTKWPLGTIRRGFVHPFHPLPAIVLLVLCIATYFAIYLGYGNQLLAMMVFYVVASVWFVLFRYRYVRRGDQFTMPWPKPRGY